MVHSVDALFVQVWIVKNHADNIEPQEDQNLANVPELQDPRHSRVCKTVSPS